MPKERQVKVLEYLSAPADTGYVAFENASFLCGRCTAKVYYPNNGYIAVKMISSAINKEGFSSSDCARTIRRGLCEIMRMSHDLLSVARTIYEARLCALVDGDIELNAIECTPLQRECSLVATTDDGERLYRQIHELFNSKLAHGEALSCFHDLLSEFDKLPFIPIAEEYGNLFKQNIKVIVEHFTQMYDSCPASLIKIKKLLGSVKSAEIEALMHYTTRAGLPYVSSTDIGDSIAAMTARLRSLRMGMSCNVLDVDTNANDSLCCYMERQTMDDTKTMCQLVNGEADSDIPAAKRNKLHFVGIFVGISEEEQQCYDDIQRLKTNNAELSKTAADLKATVEKERIEAVRTQQKQQRQQQQCYDDIQRLKTTVEKLERIEAVRTQQQQQRQQCCTLL